MSGAIVTTIERHEVDALIDWHLEQEHRAANKGEYLDADAHKKRVKEWRERLQQQVAP